MNIEPNKYYKNYYSKYEDIYNILYTDDTYIYNTAIKYSTGVLHKFKKAKNWGTIKDHNKRINKSDYLDKLFEIEEITKGDVFLELL